MCHVIDLDKCRESAGWLAMKGHMHEARQLREMADELALARAVVEAVGAYCKNRPRYSVDGYAQYNAMHDTLAAYRAGRGPCEGCGAPA